MAPKISYTRNFFFIVLFFFILISVLPSFPGVSAIETNIGNTPESNAKVKDSEKEKTWTWKEKSARRLMIGSIAPHCTYNECRGCRFKCTAEQVPVDANDPVNSAYRYRCVCHR